MGTVTNISGEDLAVSVLDGRVVKAGETVEVHDDLLHAHDASCGEEQFGTSTRVNCDLHGFVWPDTVWQVNSSPPASPVAEQPPAETQE